MSIHVKVHMSGKRTYVLDVRQLPGPGIPPLFQGNKFITDFKERAESSNFFLKAVFYVRMGASYPLIWFVILTKI